MWWELVIHPNHVIKLGIMGAAVLIVKQLFLPKRIYLTWLRVKKSRKSDGLMIQANIYIYSPQTTNNNITNCWCSVWQINEQSLD